MKPPPYELPGHEGWWEEDSPSPVKPSRAERHQVNKRAYKMQAGWPTTILLVLFVLLVLAAILFLLRDVKNGFSGGDPNPIAVAREPKVDDSLPSPDTVARRLEKAGYAVELPLIDSYDRTEHGYDVAETKINGHKAQIMAFPDIATTRDFVNVAGGTGYTIVWDKLWAISFGQNQPLEVKQLTEEIAGKLKARFSWEAEE